MCMKYFFDRQFQKHCVVLNTNGSINSEPASIIPPSPKTNEILYITHLKICTKLTNCI